jgi:hypothetical protein
MQQGSLDNDIISFYGFSESQVTSMGTAAPAVRIPACDPAMADESLVNELCRHENLNHHCVTKHTQFRGYDDKFCYNGKECWRKCLARQVIDLLSYYNPFGNSYTVFVKLLFIQKFTETERDCGGGADSVSSVWKIIQLLSQRSAAR